MNTCQDKIIQEHANKIEKVEGCRVENFLLIVFQYDTYLLKIFLYLHKSI